MSQNPVTLVRGSSTVLPRTSDWKDGAIRSSVVPLSLRGGDAMSVYESELEFEEEYEAEYEGEYEGEEFFRRIGGFLRRAAPVLRRVARVAAPIVGTAVGGPIGAVLG